MRGNVLCCNRRTWTVAVAKATTTVQLPFKVIWVLVESLRQKKTVFSYFKKTCVVKRSSESTKAEGDGFHVTEKEYKVCSWDMMELWSCDATVMWSQSDSRSFPLLFSINNSSNNRKTIEDWWTVLLSNYSWTRFDVIAEKKTNTPPKKHNTWPWAGMWRASVSCDVPWSCCAACYSWDSRETRRSMAEADQRLFLSWGERQSRHRP